MAYVKNFEEAANRHYSDGAELQKLKRHDAAGYHYGFAAECALKRCLQTVGVRDDDTSMWKHFPEISNYALLALRSRSAARVRALFERKNYMQFWDTDMRYAMNGSVTPELSEKWRKEANEAIGLLF